MSEGQAASGPEPQEAETGAAPGPVRPAVDPVALLLAVERVGADVAALRRALASQPEEVAARLDVDAATAAIGVRVGALGSALDQLRLSMLAALDRSADRVDAPAWLPDLRATLTDLAPLAAEHERFHDAVAQLAAVERTMAERPGLEPVLEAIAGLAVGERLDQLHAAVSRLADDRSNLDDIVAAVGAVDPGERLARVEHAVAELADGVRAGAAVGDALEDVGQRLASIEDAAGRVADDARLLVERVAPVPDRLSAIANQIDRITPLARAGDQAGSLFDRLDHVEGSLVEVIALLRAKGAATGDDVDERFEGVVDVLSGVTRRQDQVTAAIASVLDQVRGPKGVDAVLERMEQRERSLAARLDRIDAELRRGRDAGPGSSVEARAKPDGETARAFEVVAAMVEQQERVLALRLDQIDAELQRVREATTGVEADDEGVALRTVLERMDRQQQTLATHLDRVGQRLSEIAAHLVPDATAGDTDAGERLEARSGSKTRGGRPVDASVGSIAAITGDLARLMSTAERLDRRLARVEASLGEAPGSAARPARRATSPEVAALRLAELRAERAQVQARLQEERLLAARTWEDEER